ncbi:hypothetical protein DPMN_036496 [Dreissena polymorpha]|uniref:C2H2-type domain-containing protein n=2 Tax=Dreissena polymorpha TaxID=45954 RepID=A0A9D4MBM3_DREPO|nr:hypothetical protein DPMN_036496 [Dreissena polymorpha]
MDDSDMEYDDFKDNLAEYDEDDDFADEVDESMDANDASVEKSDSMNDKKSRMSQVEILDCPTCGKQVKGKWGLAKHMQVHIKSDSPRTPKHRKPRIKKRGLSETMPMTCEHCGKVVRGKWGLRTHINRMHIGIKDHPCQICPMQFYGRTALESHKLMVHTKRCTKCKRYIEESEPWTEDIDRFCTRNVTCLCGAVLIFSSKKNVDVGGSESELENLNDTEDVGEISDVKKELEKSILDDNEQNKQEEIAKKIKKIKDRKKQIASEITPLECTHCGQFLKGKNTLKQHIERVHLKIREHPCQICPKEFFTESDLDHHTLTVHTRKCIKCQGYVVESVPWTEGTDRFMKRDVLCACGEIVSFFSDIGPKRKIDDNEEDDGAKKMKRSYECEKCGKFFDRPTKLETHVKTHESNKQCHLCSVKFSDKASCEKHMKEAHSLVMLKCKVCKFQFSNADSLKVHYMKMHRNYLSDKGIETMLDAELDLGACEQAGQDESLASNISSILEQNQLNNLEIPLPPMVSRIDKLEQDLKPGQTMISQVDGGFIYVATKDPDLTNDGAREFVQEAIREGHVTVNSDEISIILKQLC